MKVCIDGIVIKLKSRSTYLEELHTILEQMRQAKKKKPKIHLWYESKKFFRTCNISTRYRVGLE
jgi:hypothetical protein